MIDSDDQMILDELNKVNDKQKVLDYLLGFSWFSILAVVIFVAFSVIRTVFK